MKKRVMALLATFVILFPIFTTVASRVTPRWSLLHSIIAQCYIEDNQYVGSISADDSVYKMDIDIVLYEKGLFTSYKEVSSIRKTVYNYYHTAIGNYTYSSLKDYKIELTVKAYTRSGQTETITVANEYT